MTDRDKRAPATDCVHAGETQLPGAMGINTPVVTSTTFDYREGGVRYPRYVNALNHEVVAGKIAALEGAQAARVSASGMGAISAVFLSLMKPGDHAVILDGLYGGTTDLVEGLLEPMGMRFTTWNGDPDSLAACFEKNTRLLMVESPTNPLLSIVDLAATAKIAREHDVVSFIDNTFATPILQRPIEHGFDLVMHSATKYLGGHSDLLCGALAGSTELIERIHPNIVRLGATLNGQDLALLERSIKTLAVRVERASENAAELARRLDRDPRIAETLYPGLPSHPGHSVAANQMSGFGGMLTFRIADSIDPEPFLDRLTMIRPAVSLGGVESTISQPSKTSHAKLSDEKRKALGIDDRLMRLSVGIEGVDDLWDDLDRALGGSSL
ncbi:trans-sulfuration enzyme family protein [Wenzhouxiangella sediminis]|uniref:Aminotransferase class I/II-fold pyridoxal phosphate-dependent enzyme n=1 Tax=Wenzhouxiangella sediminis TaxID=1792836 RepID=A0A3E1KBD0_9GAMM|nr:aminotransferase class I/II-fold pyridoxal phosphate-dependent enzyme [Wenzhouxiangella sediminis]RFF31838.1 aminotransferase class I/II-fold pyridoxal phosphate-dependent enzyme [Wenzhouxiangella sediminis]